MPNDTDCTGLSQVVTALKLVSQKIGLLLLLLLLLYSGQILKTVDFR